MYENARGAFISRQSTIETSQPHSRFSLDELDDTVHEAPWMSKDLKESSNPLEDEDEFGDMDDITPMDSEVDKESLQVDEMSRSSSTSPKSKKENFMKLLNDHDVLGALRESGKGEEMKEEVQEEEVVGGIGDDVAFGDFW